MSFFSRLWFYFRDLYLGFENRTVLDFLASFRIKGWIIFTPNVITVIRVIPGIISVHIAWNYSWLAGGILYGLSEWGDRLDGAMARRYWMVSRLGQYLDPAMDKLVNVYAMVFFLLKMDASPSSATLYSVTVIWLILSQFSLLGIALVKLYISMIKTNLMLTQEGANIWGKIKTLVESLVISLNILLIHSTMDFDYLAPLYGAAGVLAIKSGVGHIQSIKKRS